MTSVADEWLGAKYDFQGLKVVLPPRIATWLASTHGDLWNLEDDVPSFAKMDEDVVADASKGLKKFFDRVLSDICRPCGCVPTRAGSVIDREDPNAIIDFFTHRDERRGVGPDSIVGAPQA